jgi:hypothetical protein
VIVPGLWANNIFCEIDPSPRNVPHGHDAGRESVDAGHARYARESFDAGKILLYRPVMAPQGAFGMAVDEAEVRQVLENDPTVRAGMNKIEIHPMRVGATQGFGA